MHRTARRITEAGTEVRDELIVEEAAVALVYNGISHAVMMATPCDLEDFGRGFTLTEGLVGKPSEIYDIEVEPAGRGFEVRLDIAAQRMQALQERRRSLAGRTGCGLCGVDSLEAALRAVPAVTQGKPVSRRAIEFAMAALPGRQVINRQNGAMHAAGWANGDGSILEVREDVGRHNALDKLAGAIAKTDAGLAGGFVVVTSRCSYELVQKAAMMGASLIAAVSAPTSLAIEAAESANIGLVAFVRDGRLTVYTNPGRVTA